MRDALRSLQQEYELTKDRLQRGIEENEALSATVRELQRSSMEKVGLCSLMLWESEIMSGCAFL